MNTPQRVIRDERTVAVENVCYKWGCIFVSFALLVDVAMRGLLRNEAAWDLMVLACLPGIIASLYQAYQKALPQGFWRQMALLAVLAGVIGAVVAFAVMLTKAT